MKYLITRTERKFAVIEAENEEAALAKCEMGFVPDEEWQEDDRPYEYSNDLGEPYKGLDMGGLVL